MNPYESPQLNPFDDAPPSKSIVLDSERFCILHLVLYLIGIGIVAGVYTNRNTVANWWPLSSVTFYNLRSTAIAAVGVAALLLAAYRRWTRATTFPKHFGHWFLICDGVAWIANQPLEALGYENYGSSPPAWITVLRTLFHLVSIAMMACAIWNSNDDLHWRRYAWCRLMISVWAIFQTLFLATGNVWMVTIVVVALTIPLMCHFGIALYGDFWTWRRRDYLHWVGICAEASVHTSSLVGYASLLLQTAANA